MKLTAITAALVLHAIALFGLDMTMREGTDRAQLAAVEPVRIVVTARRHDTVAAAPASALTF